MPHALATDRQLKNFSSVILTDLNIDSILLIKFIWDFRRPGMFQTNQEQVAHKIQLIMKAVWLYLQRLH